MSHYRTENVRISQAEFCLPSHPPYTPWSGIVLDLPSHVIPSDIPSTLLDSFSEQFSLQPEQALSQFLDSNPNLANPRDIGRILFHTPRLSPYAISVILFNSSYSSRALTFSFMSAIDLDCISILDGIRFITQKVAIPTRTTGIQQFASSFASAYGLRNQLEWPDPQNVSDILCAVLCFCVLGGDFEQHVGRFESLKSVSKYLITQMGSEVKRDPPALFFTSVPIYVDLDEDLAGEVEHEGRFRSSWKAYRYAREGDDIVSRDLKDKRRLVNRLPLQQVTARQKFGNAKKPHCLSLQRLDGGEFGWKGNKDGALKPISRTSYVLAFRSETELLQWMSGINQLSLVDELRALN
jgi:hypothetical protein